MVFSVAFFGVLVYFSLTSRFFYIILRLTSENAD